MTLFDRRADAMEASARFGSRRNILAVMGLLGVTLLAYWPAVYCDFINYDDPKYVTANHVVRQGLTMEGLAWAVRFQVSNWHPLTWISHMLDAHLFQVRPWGHHLSSVLLHAANTALLFLTLLRMTRSFWPSVLCAALFGWHPLRVESVAWVAERKDVLSTFFWILTLLAYTNYTRRPSVGRYVFVAVALALGLMSKPMLLALPFVLLLLDYWPLDRLRLSASDEGGRRRPLGALILEKTPLLVLSALSAVVTVLAQRFGESIISLRWLSIEMRLANAFVSCARYLGKTVWPVDLSIHYPLPVQGWPPFWVATGFVMVATITAGALWLGQERRYLLVGWLWFLGTLIPVMGLVQVGMQAMADRYMYVPHMGLFIAFAWCVAGLVKERPRARGLTIVAAAAALLLLLAVTLTQLGHWRDSVCVFHRALQVNERFEEEWGIELDLRVVRTKLGEALFQKGERGGALEQLEKVLAVDPNFKSALHDVGRILFLRGRYSESLAYFDRAVQEDSGFVEAHIGRGSALASLGRIHEALESFERALRLDPRNPSAIGNRGFALHSLGRTEEAIPLLQEAVRLEPDEPAYRFKLGLAYEGAGRLEAAAGVYRDALERLDPGERPGLRRQLETRLGALESR